MDVEVFDVATTYHTWGETGWAEDRRMGGFLWDVEVFDGATTYHTWEGRNIVIFQSTPVSREAVSIHRISFSPAKKSFTFEARGH